MKKLYLVMMLLPFMHQQRYPMQYVSCNETNIQLKDEQNTYDVKLFNIYLKQGQPQYQVCELLEDASNIEIEFDPLIEISEPLNAYIFIDGELLQEKIIKQELGYSKIDNPNYLYYHQMQSEQKVINHQVVESATITKKIKYSFLLICYSITLFCVCIYHKIKV